MTDQVDRLTTALSDRYVIEREIGAGGMATVYLAEDVKHGRKVASKTLKPELVAVLGGERFLREIKLTASLNHPHILPLLDSGEADHLLYYVMPFVQGESLREKLNRETQLPIDEALRLGEQVAGAVDHAHCQGVMHRDIKPENILLHEGVAMIADFGIALALNAAGGDRLTETGLSIGTPEYMSPEQASGARQLDERSDVYALGCVLYEMLTGDPPFTGQSPQAIIARQVLDPPPNIATVRPSVSRSVEHVVLRALAKAPADRWQTAKELGDELKSVSKLVAVAERARAAVSGGALSRKVSRRMRLGTASVVVTVALVIGFVLRPDVGQPPISAPEHSQLTFSGRIDRAEISPSGEWLAYVEDGESDRLYVQDLTGGSVIALGEIGIGPYSNGAMSFRWSPDGLSLLVSTAGGPYTVRTLIYPRFGGAPRLPPRYASPNTIWSPDGTHLATWRRVPSDALAAAGLSSTESTHTIRIVSLASGDSSLLVPPDSIGAVFSNGDWSPDGRFIALTTSNGADHTMWTVTVDGAKWQPLLEGGFLSSPRWSPSGDALYYLRNVGGPRWELRKLYVTEDGTAEGDPVVLPVGLLRTYYVSLSADGEKLVFIDHDNDRNLWWATTDPRDGQLDLTTAQLTRSTASIGSGQLSPDGAWIAYEQRESAPASSGRGILGDIFVIPTDGGTPRRVTSSGEVFGAPVWSPDGTTLAFRALADGKYQVHTVRLDGGQTRSYDASELDLRSLWWAPGDRILYRPPRSANLFLLDPDTGTITPLVANDSVGTRMIFAQYSPDGQRVAVDWDRTDGSGIWLISLNDATQQRVYDRVGERSSTGVSVSLAWASDGSSLYVQRADSLLRVPVNGGDVTAISTIPRFDAAESAECRPIERPYRLSFLCSVFVSRRDVFMIENFDPRGR